jgi:hypothetical protein
MKRCLTPWSLLIKAFALASFTAGLGAQNENMPAAITMNKSIGALRASHEAGETPYCKGVIWERQPIFAPVITTLKRSTDLVS